MNNRRIAIKCHKCFAVVAFVSEAKVMTARAFAGAFRKTVNEFVAEIADAAAVDCPACESKSNNPAKGE